MNKEILKILDNFKDKNILVIGDVMLDEYVIGGVERISPEAPIPVLRVNSKKYVLGGAGNVAANISSLGGNAILMCFFGQDEGGQKIKEIAEKNNIKLIPNFTKSTIRKTRVISNNQQIVRIDEEDTTQKYFDKELIQKECQNADLIIISDYAKGAITNELVKTLPKHKKIIVDPKPKNKISYKGLYLLTPNKKEALELSGCENIYTAGKELQEKFDANVIITRGEEGMTIFNNGVRDIPTQGKEVYDVSGAGDTVIAVLGLSLASNANLEESAIIANYAAGIAVEKIGTSTVNINELKNKISHTNKKTKTIDELKEIIKNEKNKGKKIIWTNGCFDILHKGHVKYLKEAKKLGDILIIGLNSDESIKKLKGENRPIQSEGARTEIISSLEFVDYVIVFDKESPAKIISIIKPDIFTKGGDYTAETMNQEERKAIEEYSGEIIFIPIIENESTTNIINRMSDLKG